MAIWSNRPSLKNWRRGCKHASTNFRQTDRRPFPLLPMKAPQLDNAQVHVWTACLCAEGTAPEHLYAVLADEERARADRFLRPEPRRRFIVARAVLRRLLSTYAGVDASALRFGRGAYGKPYLMGDSRLRFNLSHAQEMAMYAFASHRDVGIDIESTTRDIDIEGVARHVFSAAECETLSALAPGARRAAFFRSWTRKEAYVKARGDGLGDATRLFSVSQREDDDDSLVADERDAQARLHWRVAGLGAPPGFSAALAAKGRDWSVRRFVVPMMKFDTAHLRDACWPDDRVASSPPDDRCR